MRMLNNRDSIDLYCAWVIARGYLVAFKTLVYFVKDREMNEVLTAVVHDMIDSVDTIFNDEGF